MSMEPVVTTSSPTVITDPSTAQYDATFGPASDDFKKLMGPDFKPTNFDSAEAVLEVLQVHQTMQLLVDLRARNDGLKTWLELYVDLLFTVSAHLWENTQAPPSPEKTICNAIVVLIETAYKVRETYKSLVDFFDRLQYFLQRVNDLYVITEFNIAGMKLLLLNIMAKALSSMVDYVREMREKPIKKALKVITRRKDFLMPPRINTLMSEEPSHPVSRSASTPSTPPWIGEEVPSFKLPFWLRHWLGPPNHLIDHENAHPRTGKWCFQGRAFRWWKRREKGASLLICGEPGSGKTILCSSIIEEVNRTRNKSEIIACYYFDSKIPDKRNFRGLLASLITQLNENSQRLPESVPALYAKCRHSLNLPSEAELTQLLHHFLAELQAQFSIYIIIDGVDNSVETESTGEDLECETDIDSTCIWLCSHPPGPMWNVASRSCACISTNCWFIRRSTGVNRPETNTPTKRFSWNGTKGNPVT